MSLSASLSAAVGGLDLTTRRAEVVARNVANSDQAGYASRGIETSGGGIGTPGSGSIVTRSVDPRLVQLRRESESALTGDEIINSFHARLDEAFGDPDQSGSLQDRLARFDAALVTASVDPNSEVGLGAAVDAAVNLTETLNKLDAIITTERQEADTEIGRAVALLNSDLSDVAELNADIRRLNSGGHDVANLLDQRGLLIDRISSQIPVRELPRDGGVVALVSQGGLLLIDGDPATFSFESRSPITPSMTSPIQLSTLSYNGREVPVSGGSNSVPGGGLEQLFKVRDEIAPEATQQLDSLAAEIIDRFEDSTLDTSRATGDPGLFTDNGASLPATPDEGLAGRIEVNSLVREDLGGETWRLRDGLGSASESSGENSDLLLGYSSTIAQSRVPVLSGLPSTSGSLIDHFATLKSIESNKRISSEDQLSLSQARSSELIAQRDGGAVDIDSEMRRLVEIEQTYAANARVIQAVSEMMNRITEI